MGNRAEIHPLQLGRHLIVGQTPQPLHIAEAEQAGVRQAPVEFGTHQQKPAVGPLQGDPAQQIDVRAIPERADIAQNRLGAGGPELRGLRQKSRTHGLIDPDTGSLGRKLFLIHLRDDGDEVGHGSDSRIMRYGSSQHTEQR